MTASACIALLLVVLIASALQRVSGMGFALVAVPVLALLLGTREGVLVSNLASLLVSALGLLVTWQRVLLRVMVPMVVAAAVGAPLGAWLVARLPERVLLACVGLAIVGAVLLVVSGARVRALCGRRGALAAGGAGGFMNAAAGVGGPAFALYAANAEWPAERFVPNAQFSAVAVNVLSLSVKGPPSLTAGGWWAFGAGMAGGALVGTLAARRTSDVRVRQLVLGLALFGGATAVLKAAL